MTPVKKTMTLSIILIFVGVSLTILGIVLLTKNPNKLVETEETIPKENGVFTTEKQKGDDFEKFIVQKFSKNYFTVLEWTSDKYIQGRYAKSNMNPDLTLRLKLKDLEKDFAVECKYRSTYYKNGVEWGSGQQLQHYKSFATDKRIPVFVAIGIGGVANAPEELFIIPLTEISDTFLTKSFLSKYKKQKIKDSNLFYDYEAGRLK
jgi:hypothetical protein